MGLRKNILHIANKILSRLHLELIKQKDLGILRGKTEAYEEILCLKKDYSNTGCEAVVFSKDRPIQLHAFLSSYYNYVMSPVKLTVLYRASNAAYNKAFEEIASMFRDREIEFVQETKFKNDLLDILNKIASERIMFFVDDIIFIRDVDLNIFNSFSLEEYVPSLRLGAGITFSYTCQKKHGLPEFRKHSFSKEFLIWNWEDGQYAWGYPLSMDGNIFNLAEIKTVIKYCDFKSPNTLETELQNFNGLYKRRKGVCLQNPSLLNIPFNKVQTDNTNIAGEIDIAFLLEEWNKGKCIDYMFYKNCASNSVHKELELMLKPRNI